LRPLGAYTVIVGRLTWVDAPDSRIGSGAKSGGVPGQIGAWTCPGEGCQTAAGAAGAVAAAELVNAIRQAANSSRQPTRRERRRPSNSLMCSPPRMSRSDGRLFQPHAAKDKNAAKA
jgi:hypothetical protein